MKASNLISLEVILKEVTTGLREDMEKEIGIAIAETVAKIQRKYIAIAGDAVSVAMQRLDGRDIIEVQFTIKDLKLS